MDAKLYYKVGGRAAAGDWNELTNTRDVTLNLSKSEAGVTTRGNDGWRATKGALKDASIDFEMVHDPDDAGFSVIMDAFLNGTVIGLAAMDGAIATGTGLQADCEILNFTRTEALEEALKVAVTAKPTYSADAPRWLENGAEATGTGT